MSEKKLYKTFKKNWGQYIKRVETKLEDGFPDLHLLNSNGDDIFIELKYLPKEFKACTLPIKASQFKWHSEYKGKRSYIMFQIGDVYFLFKSNIALELRGKIKWEVFNKNALICDEKIENILNILR